MKHKKLSMMVAVFMVLTMITPALANPPFPEPVEDARPVTLQPPEDAVLRPYAAQAVRPAKPIDQPNIKDYLRNRRRQELMEAGQAVEVQALDLTGTDRALVILVEFAGTDVFVWEDGVSTWDPYGRADPAENTETVGDCSNIITQTTVFTYTGTLHNEIPRPVSPDDASGDSIWTEDFSPEWFDGFLFGEGVVFDYTMQDGTPVFEDFTGQSVRDYYEDLSNGSYSITGDVVGWLQLPHSTWWYGADECPGARSGGGSSNGAIPGAGSARTLVMDALDAVNAIKDTIPGFDWANYDLDGDGIIDRLWIVHAGYGEEDSPTLLNRTDYGEASLWSHSSSLHPPYEVAPGISAVPYIMMPENGGIGVFAHEAGHNLGADDLYAYGHGETSAGFWTVMADDWTGHPIGFEPPAADPWHLDNWGWLDPFVITDPSQVYEVTLGQASRFPGGEDVYRGAKIVLPDGVLDLPVSVWQGDHYWWGGKQDLSNATMTTVDPIAIPAAGATLSFDLVYDIEDEWDFLWIQSSLDGEDWDTLTNANTQCVHHPNWIGGLYGFPDDLCGAGLGGFWGYNENWPDPEVQEFDLGAYAGQSIYLRFWYMTDWGTTYTGAFVDNVAVTADGTVLFADDAESGDSQWDYEDPWQRTNGTQSFTHSFYLQWRNVNDNGGYDSALGDERWRFGPANTGLLVWYNNNSYTDNEIYGYLEDDYGFGPKGRMLVVDSHPEPYRDPNVEPSWLGREHTNVTTRSQMRDAPFTLEDTADFTYGEVEFQGRPAVSSFHDSVGYCPGVADEGDGTYWSTVDWDASVALPATGRYSVAGGSAYPGSHIQYVEGAGWLGYWDAGTGGTGDPGDDSVQYGWHVELIEEAADHTWGRVRIYNDQAEPEISEVKATNVRDTSFTISWITDIPSDGHVNYGTDPANLDQTAQDDRGAGTSDDTHHITLLDLSPETTYYFDLISDGTVDDNEGPHYTVTTGPTLDLPTVDTIYGQVFEEDETTLAEGAIVYITLFDDDGSGSPDEAAPLSALVDDTGYWYANLGNTRTSDLSDYFVYSASGDKLKLEAQGAADGAGYEPAVDTGNDTPAPTIYLSHTVIWDISLQLGWNHISLPLDPLISYTAEGVCDEIISQGGDVTEIDRWHASGWDGHICGLPFNDFPLELGADYFIKSSAASIWTIEGYRVTTPVPLALEIGWNSIGVPHTDAYTAESLCVEINDQCGDGVALEVDRWHASGWDGHICGLPFNDFDVEIGKGYFVKASDACTLTPDGGGLVEVTILHTNDLHGRLETDYQGRGGSAYMAGVINDVRDEVGEDNVFLMDAGDVFFGAPPISQLLLGESTIDIYNMLGYDVAALGNHEFDKGQDVLQARVAQSGFPWLGANIVLEGANWEHPTWIEPYVILSKDGVDLGIIGLATDETPVITIMDATDGLEFRDLTEAVLHYYDEVKAQSDAQIVLAHMGTEDAGEFKSLQTVAQELIDAGKPVDVMIAGHQHQPLYEPVMVGDTSIIEAGYYGRWLGRADVTIDPSTKSLTIDNYELLTINNTLTPDTDVEARVQYWADQVAPLIEQVVGYTNVSLVRDYNGESNTGNLVTDGMRWKADLLDDGEANGSVDIAFTNPGGLRADIEIPVGAELPYPVTWGDTFNVMPFGNTLFLMDLTGAQIQELLDQAATLYKGILQTSGGTWYWYNDCNCTSPTVWGAYDVTVNGETLDSEETYRVVTNNFLAGGRDGWATFAEGTNRWDTSYDMQEAVNDYIALNSPISPSVEGRIVKLDKLITILHTNDTHSNWSASTYRGDPNGMVYLASHIAAERARNPNTLLLDAGDTFQGNAFAQYFRNDTPNPIAGGMNLLEYDALVLGNHEFNFGSATFASMLGQVDFSILGNANLDDDGAYGFINDHVEDYIAVNVDSVDVAIFGLTNPRVPRYELPTNITGLTFYPATETAAALVPTILATEDPDLLIGLTHIGYQPYGDELDSDQLVAQDVAGIDVIVGGHSHTRLDPAVMVTSDINPEGTLVAQAYKYAQYLGKINVGLVSDGADGYDVVMREGYLLPAGDVDADADLAAYLEPFEAELDTYISQEIGQTTAPIDALEGYTQETNGANLQVDASMWELGQHGIAADFHLSGAMTNRKVADGATPMSPVTLTVDDMYTLMPYENSLLVMQMNGPQIKAILERSYRNYWYYKYDAPSYGGYSHYTTCMLDINQGGVIAYSDAYPAEPDGNNVASLVFDGTAVDFADAATYYNVSTVNYVAAGSCNFNDDGVTIWPLDQVVHDTQYYVRDAVINYIMDQATISPQIEGRLQFME